MGMQEPILESLHFAGLLSLCRLARSASSYLLLAGPGKTGQLPRCIDELFKWGGAGSFFWNL
jgi:hypothetical protein